MSAEPAFRDDRSTQRHLRIVMLCGGMIGILCAVLTCLSQAFSWGRSYQDRPIWTFFWLMTAACVLHLTALRSAIRLRNHRHIGTLIILLGLGYRLLLLPSHLIQEIDIYRYMWDGAVLADGGNPYQFSPKDVLQADAYSEGSAFARVCALRDSSETLKEILERVHFSHLTTIYPPVSQCVFAAAMTVVPAEASVPVARTVMKFFISIFDVLTMFGILCLLRQLRKPVGWLICYAWSPLVLKEFANSGHLDAVAIALTTWAVVFWIRAADRVSTLDLLTAALLLGLGVGAKLYPVVLVPVIVCSVWRTFGFRGVLLSGSCFLIVSGLTVLPMFRAVSGSAEQRLAKAQDVHLSPVAAKAEPPLPADFEQVTGIPDLAKGATAEAETRAATPEPDDGFSAFVSHWRINDLIFLFVNENLRPDSEAWFSILPIPAKQAVLSPVMRWAGLSQNQAAFGIARGIVAVAHLAILCWLAVLTIRAPVRHLPGLAFYSLAWFWFLLPTQNPWYWIWAMPLMPFVRLRSWLLISGMVVIYYLRFWLQNDLGETVVPGTSYTGAAFFHQVVVWFEHLPVLLLLLAEWLRKRVRLPVSRR